MPRQGQTGSRSAMSVNKGGCDAFLSARRAHFTRGAFLATLLTSARYAFIPPANSIFKRTLVMRLCRDFVPALSRSSPSLGRRGASTAAHADSGTIRISVVKGGWVIGGSGRQRRAGLPRPALSAVDRRHELWPHLRRIADQSGRQRDQYSPPSDVAGVYGAAGAGLAVGGGAQAIVLRNEKGAMLTLSGRQVGLIASADLSGLAIALR